MTRIDRKNIYLTIILTIVLHFLIAGVMTRYAIFYWSRGPSSINGDVKIYFGYVKKTMNGGIPYRDYVVEYPIGAIPAFLIPGLFARDFEGYQVAFGIEMLLFDAAIIILLAHQVRREHGTHSVALRLGWYTLFFAALCPLPTGRYDLVPTAMAFAACCAWSRGWRGLGGILAGVGTLTKIFPGVAAAPALLGEVRDYRPWRCRGLPAFGVAAAALALAWFLIGRAGVKDSLYIHGKRGLEIESLYAGILYIIYFIFKIPILIIDNFGSTNIYFRYYEILLMAIPAIQLAAILGAAWRYLGRRDGDEFRYAAAALLGFLAAGKVLSPQYMIWLAPFAAVLGGRTGARARPIFFLCCLMTRLIYPGPGFGGLGHVRPAAVILLNSRNLLLLVIYAILLFTRERHVEAKPEHAPTPGECMLESQINPVEIPGSAE
jgi:hypothetical protein